MKAAVVGSRSFKNYDYLSWVLDGLRIRRGDFTLVSGGARGADTLAKKYADEHKIESIIIEPDWDDLSNPDAVVKRKFNGKPYDALAGFRRNQKIVDLLDPYEDLMIAFIPPNNPTPGTSDTISRARAKGIKVYEFWKD